MNSFISQPDTTAIMPDANTNKIPDMHRFEHQAMATFFEIYLLHENKSYAEQAAQAAFSELDRLEQELSRFIDNSDISRINAMKKYETITIGPDVLNCLVQCSALYQSTKGAFDISAGELFALWKEGDPPTTKNLADVRAFIGLPWLRIDKESFRVTLLNESINLDLGGFGKGYALDQMAQVLADWDIKSGFMHSGQSTILIIGDPPDPENWRFSIHHPLKNEQLLQKIRLKAGALSGSGLQKGRHIIDPRSGRVVQGFTASWAVAPSAGLADGLSTAMMVMDQQELVRLEIAYPECGGLLLPDGKDGLIRIGNWPKD